MVVLLLELWTEKYIITLFLGTLKPTEEEEENEDDDDNKEEKEEEEEEE